ncbi:MAG: 4-hydroxybutyrate CoA-transferase [Oscillospiraceae bacterium]|nr:4-hydroxybutyrate CoA-transferase [Oscillospiraceae bacterium]
MNWREQYKDRLLSPAEAAAYIRSGDVICSSMGCGIPYLFLDALADRMKELDHVTLHELTMSKQSKLFHPKYNGRFRTISGFFNAYERGYKNAGIDISFQPLHLHTFPDLQAVSPKPTVVAVAGTPPDENGMISFGPNPIRADMADRVDRFIVQINENLPYIKGDQGVIHVDKVDLLVDGTEDVFYQPAVPVTEVEEQIGSHIVDLVPDGACIQLGIGSVGAAVGSMLRDKKDLGIHTEMFVEPMMDLIRCGAVNNSRKPICPGISIFGFAGGSKELYDFLDHNDALESRPFDFVNNPRVVAQIPNFVSINSALQVDLMGQVCAETMGFLQYSGTGGQVDFVRGANASPGGKSFIALSSSRIDKKGQRQSKITLSLPVGSAVTTPRTDVHYIVTEYGAVNLRGASLEERAKGLISIAHPDFRDELSFQAKQAGLIL